MTESNTDVECTARMLWEGAGYWSSYVQAKEQLERMIECGHKYNYLNKEIGTGVCLVLGTTLSESQYASNLLFM